MFEVELYILSIYINYKLLQARCSAYFSSLKYAYEIVIKCLICDHHSEE